ncbi:MAG: lysophospholipid acyltransferase family protein [Cellvibrionaceae bacterium]|nr:lysophospholipid acyltransferase family protein [Cellvibrionaceae bacterium]
MNSSAKRLLQALTLLARYRFAHRLCLRLAKRYGSKVFGSRCRIIDTNLRLCFPHLAEAEIIQLRQQNLLSTLAGYLDTIYYFSRPLALMAQDYELHNIEVVERIRGQNKGVLLLGGHFTCLDLAGIAVAFQLPITVSYRAHDNPELDAMICLARRRWANKLVSSKRPREMVASLRRGELLWYAPDQDVGSDGSVFSPFFNIPTATTLAIARLAQLGRAAVVPISFYRRARDGKIIVEFGPELHCPGGKPELLVDQYNQFLEHKIRAHPEQYLWAHRRFKTRPDGVADRYR